MKKEQVVNTETGELMWVLVPVRQRYLGGFFLAMQEGFLHLAKMNLKQEETKVLFHLFGKLDFENWLRVSQTEIAKELGMKRPAVSRAIKNLAEKGIIHKGPKVGTSWTYRLDPGLGWKGRLKNRKAAERAILKAKEKGWDVIEGSDS